MEILFLRATYLDEKVITNFLLGLFGEGRCGIEVWMCLFPRFVLG